MLNSNERFHSANGRRRILIAEDEFINREILRLYLQDDYDLLFATNGQEALDIVHENKDTLSLILLDLIMPVMSGMEMLKAVKADPEVAQIPVIVISGDQDSEVECLTVGAIDFILKPYPHKDVIIARVVRTIMLIEDRDTISQTERDELTKLYNREYFYHYAEQYDQYHRDEEMDAIVVNVNHFRMINERFGAEYGDDVLRRIGNQLLAAVQGTSAMVCRREADTFLIYCPHGFDYAAILDKASVPLSPNEGDDTPVWMRMGVYAQVDKSLDIERRFDRAKMAADTVRSSFTQRIGFYDSKMHDKELFSERLVQDFDTAIRERQFKVFFQPKYDISGDEPVLASAEALVRWQHPEFGLIPPVVFVPLFEDNGLVQRLDQYVWRETARQIRDWKDRLGMLLPVSVNVSRIDMYDPQLVDTLLRLLEESGLETHELLLEITESAYTQESVQIIETVRHLRDLGFRVEMDDFGTGYSSLNMISTLPIDALKLDMQFVRNAFNERQDTRMIEVIIDIADYLAVPVIAEGVETEEQMLALKEMRCRFAQGYFFSPPVPADKFEPFILEQIAKGTRSKDFRGRPSQISSLWQSTITYASIVHALAMDYFCIYYVDTDSDRYIEYRAREGVQELGVRNSGDGFFAMFRETVGSQVHPDDRTMFLEAVDKDAILAELESNRTFTITYRLVSGDKTSYVHLKATRMEDSADRHVVIGVSNVDDLVRREQEHERALRMANQDALTGVKSKHAYDAEQRSIDRAIATGEQVPFAVVVCDVNDLKFVNDTMGHTAGDQHLKDACMVVCNIFKHSPVFRVGGDEFCAILRGSDYQARAELMRRLESTNQHNKMAGEVTVAGGIAVWDPECDTSLAEVFARADTAMYEDKEHYKSRESAPRD